MTNKPIQINIDEIIKSKNEKLFNRIPKFLLNWFKKFIHQDYINEILRKGHGTEGKEFVEVVFEELKINVICPSFVNLLGPKQTQLFELTREA